LAYITLHVIIAYILYSLQFQHLKTGLHFSLGF